MKSPTVGVCVLALVTFLVSPRVTAQSTTLVPTESIWKYLDNGSDQGTIWRTLQFDDTSWPSGAAQLGFGDGDEATTVSRTGSAGGTNIT